MDTFRTLLLALCLLAALVLRPVHGATCDTKTKNGCKWNTYSGNTEKTKCGRGFYSTDCPTPKCLPCKGRCFNKEMKNSYSKEVPVCYTTDAAYLTDCGCNCDICATPPPKTGGAPDAAPAPAPKAPSTKVSPTETSAELEPPGAIRAPTSILALLLF